MRGAARPSDWSWAWLALRVCLATALVLSLASGFSVDIVSTLKPVLQWAFEWAAPDYQVLQFNMSTDRGQKVLTAMVQQQRTLFVGDRVVVPGAASISGTGATVGTVLQPLLVAVVLVLSWPIRLGWEWPWRVVLVVPLLAVVMLLDTPLSMAAWLWFAQVQVHGPVTASPLLWWNTFLGAGGRLVLGLVAAAMAIALAQRVVSHGASRAANGQA